MATLPVKLFRSDDPGAPTLNGVAGALTNVLDGCLLTGYNTRAATSLTQSGGAATMTLQSGHGFAVNQVVAVSGFNEAAFNGDFWVTGVGATTLQFAVAGNPASPATGAGGVKVSPAGWTKIFPGTDKAAYQGAGGTGFVLRADV